jgi:hypothetical protein
MDSQIDEMQKTIDSLVKANAELNAWKQEHNSQKQSFLRMSARLKKLCKKLTPSSEIVIEMQQLAQDIRELVKEIVK